MISIMIIIAWILFRTIDLNQTRIDEFISSTWRPNQNSGRSRREVFFPVNLNLSEVKAVDVISQPNPLFTIVYLLSCPQVNICIVYLFSSGNLPHTLHIFIFSVIFLAPVPIWWCRSIPLFPPLPCGVRNFLPAIVSALGLWHPGSSPRVTPTLFCLICVSFYFLSVPLVHI